MPTARTVLTSLALACMIAAMPAGAQVIIAHRGASADAPENTLAAFRLAWEQGADGAEGDFYLSRDGQIVCIHDASTKRTGDKTLDVAKSTFDELRTVDLGKWKHPRFAGERIATLAEVLATVPAGKLFYIEIKCGPEILPELQRVLAAAPVKPEQLRVIAFSAKVIAESKKRLPQVKAQWLTSFKADEKTKASTPSDKKILKTLKETNADGLNAQADVKRLTPAFVAELKSLKLETGAWTVDDPKVAKALVEAGVAAITTNKPKALRDALRRD